VNAYKIYFNAYQIHDVQKVPFLLDGQILAMGAQELKTIRAKMTATKIGGGTAVEKIIYTPEKTPVASQADAFWQGLSDMHPQALERRAIIKKAAMQGASFELALLHARMAAACLSVDEAIFLRDNLSYPAELMARLSLWLKQVLLAHEQLDLGDVSGCSCRLEEAADTLAGVAPLADAYCHGQWKEWYKGCIILNVPANLQRTREVAAQAKKGQR